MLQSLKEEKHDIKSKRTRHKGGRGGKPHPWRIMDSVAGIPRSKSCIPLASSAPDVLP